MNQRLYDAGQRLLERAQEKINTPRLSNTARRARMAGNAIAEAERDTIIAQTAMAIAQEEPANLTEFKSIKTIRDIEWMVARIEYNQSNGYGDYKQTQYPQSTLDAYMAIRSTGKKEDPLKKALRGLVGHKGFDFFPTPQHVAQKMAGYINPVPDMKILEPSAGIGNLCDAMVEAGATKDNITTVEPDCILREILSMKGYRLTPSSDNFMDKQLQQCFFEQFDAVIMNPPFSNKQDVEHVTAAYNCLKSGGRLVAIVSEGTMFRSDSKTASFRERFMPLLIVDEKLPAGTFADRTLPTPQTMVASRILVIDKPV